MNREIEFRAWLKHRRTKMICKVVQIDFDVKRILLLDIERNIQLGWYDFDDIELMQYTGLKDKNGVKIFEGDIVKYDYELYVVKFENGCFNFCQEFANYNDWIQVSSCEIIGNIYENPELLEVYK